MKEVREELRYDQDVNTVFGLISTGAFQLELIAHIGGHNAEVVEDNASANGSVRLVTRQRTGVELPGFAKKLIPANTTVTQTYEWGPPEADGSRTGTWSADAAGAPVTIGGPTELKPDGDGCVHRYLGTVKASVPLVGGKLESFALDNLRKELKRTQEFTAGRLGSHGDPGGH